MTNFVNIRKKSQNIRFILRFINWKVVLLLTAVAALLCSCRTQYVPVESVRTETQYIDRLQKDSIFVKDSVFIKEKNDTIYLTKWRTEYKEALRVDTFNVERVDTLNTIVEVEKKLTKVQQLKMDVGAGVMYAVPILIAVGLFILYRKLKK
jgi:hypothetical protein